MNRTYDYVTVDVFTSDRFAGNPLAVIPDARGLTTLEMQAIAREFNYSESTFVLPAQHPERTNADAHVRILPPSPRCRLQATRTSAPHSYWLDGPSCLDGGSAIG